MDAIKYRKQLPICAWMMYDIVRRASFCMFKYAL